jgi:hypothetical protein
MLPTPLWQTTCHRRQTQRQSTPSCSCQQLTTHRNCIRSDTTHYRLIELDLHQRDHPTMACTGRGHKIHLNSNPSMIDWCNTTSPDSSQQAWQLADNTNDRLPCLIMQQQHPLQLDIITESIHTTSTGKVQAGLTPCASSHGEVVQKFQLQTHPATLHVPTLYNKQRVLTVLST